MKRTGQITRIRNGTYQIRIQRRDKETGKLKSISQTVHGTRDDAKEVLSLLIEKIKRAKAEPKREHKTFNELFSAYLEVVKPNVREQTYYHYNRVIRVYLLPEFGEMSVADLDTYRIEQFYARLQKKYSGEFIFKIHTQLKCALRRAKAWKWIKENPVENVRPPKRIRHPKEILTLEEIGRFFDACPTFSTKTQWAFFALTGARAQEVFAARWRDVDFERKIFRVRQVLVQMKEVKKFDIPKTDKSRRDIPLSSDLLELLKKHKAQQNVIRLKAGALWIDNDLIFPTAYGKPQRLSNIGEKVNKIKEAAGIDKKVTPHLFRHSFISNSINNGADIKLVSEIAGHSSVKMTLDVYQHTTEAGKERIIDEMSRKLLKAM